MNGLCRIDGSALVEVIDFGEPCVSDFVTSPDEGVRFPLRLGVSPASGLLQLFDSYPAEKMFKQYWYLSSINESMKVALRDIVDAAQRWAPVSTGDVVVDIGCNDGTLLSCWPDGVKRVGFDPAENLAVKSRQHADVIVSDFFTGEAFQALGLPQKARVITSIAMFYDLEDPHAFVEGIRQSLHQDGIWVMQIAYTPLMLSQNAFDNACHEHLCYYTLGVLDALFWRHEMRVVDVELNNVNGGSFRVYVAHSRGRTDAPLYDVDIGRFRVRSMLDAEKALGLTTPEPYREFVDRVETQRRRTLAFLQTAKSDGKLVLGYGASTKGNTLLQHYGITADLLPAIADRSPAKHGRYTAGSGIPIISEEEMRSRRPDYLLALPWHFIPHFVRREQDLIGQGTRFVVPLPELQVV